MKGVIFDFNGTLFVDNDKHVLAWNKISREIRGKDITDDELLNHFNGVPNAKIIAYLTDGKADDQDIQHYSLLKEQYYREFCQADTPNFHLIAGAADYFKKLNKEGIPFTIASASIRENIDFFVKNFHLDDYMDPAKIVYDDGSYNNKVAMFSEAARKIGQSVSDCRIYEDSLSGIQGAYTAGCRDIWLVDTADHGNEYGQQPGVTKIIKNFQEVLS